jgi:tetratricopeptide (TPR) repeat protein
MSTIHLYKKDFEDKHNILSRSHSEAEQGRIKLALERIQDLLIEFPDDATVLYSQGLLLRDFLGKGIEAVKLFELAFQKASVENEIRGLAAFNIATLAKDQGTFDKWYAITSGILPNDKQLKNMKDANERLQKSGNDYHEVMVVSSLNSDNYITQGSIVARLEIALAFGSFEIEKETNIRYRRAFLLRELDLKAANIREMLVEKVPPTERLALIEALTEIEKAINLDEYNAEFWNFRAAWCMLLQMNDEAIIFADKAISLRPYQYAKPWINKALAYWNLMNFEQMLKSAKEAVVQAIASGDSKDIADAKKLVVKYDTIIEAPDVNHFINWVKDFMNAVMITSRKEISQEGWSGNYENIEKGFLKRTNRFGNNWNPLYLKIMSEMLTFFTPETCWGILATIQTKNFPVYDHSLNTLLYIIINSKGVLQRDSARLFCLLLMGTLSIKDMRSMYRQAVLETAFASEDFNKLPIIICEEFEKINPELIEFIAKQEPVDNSGGERAKRNILWRFDSTQLSKNKARQPPRTGCLNSMLLLFVLLFTCAFVQSKDQKVIMLSGQESLILVTSIAVIVGAVLIIALIRKVKKHEREHICAGCGRRVQHIKKPKYIDLPGIMISTNAFRSGSEGIGRYCEVCGRTYCSSCEPPMLRCLCGKHLLSQIHLSYRSRM